MAMLLQQRAPAATGRRVQAQATRACLPQNPRRLRARCAASATETMAAELAPREVAAELEKTSWTSRKLYASINVQAPTQVVWSCLTNYEGLGNFIPSLAENECMERRSDGAVLRQVGAQEVAMGVSFSAACTLDCTEYPQGVPMELCSMEGDGQDGLLPYPRNSQQDVPSMDITFRLVEGDFQDFRGIWRMQPDSYVDVSGTRGTLLCYSLYVQPMAWLPVRLIQGRIQKEVSKNLEAVRQHAEQLHKESKNRQEDGLSADVQSTGNGYHALMAPCGLQALIFHVALGSSDYTF